MLQSPRFLLALWTGKAAIWLNRRIGHGGTSFPGTVSRKLAPSLLTALARQLPQGSLFVTGTNGKTTTSKMIAAIAAGASIPVTHNRAGANLIGGITTAFIDSASALGQLRGRLGIIEVDEATVPQLVQEVQPRVVIVTNFFRDQLDRFGELDKTVQLVSDALGKLPKKSVVLLNADDPLVAHLGRFFPGKVIYYGMDDRHCGSATMQQSAETRFCRACGHPLTYDWYYFGQLGHYRCTNCNLVRPQPSIVVRQIELRGEQGSRFTVETPEQRFDLTLSTPGFYNIYNALAAVALAVQLKLPAQAIEKGLQGYRTNFGRMEQLPLPDNKKAFLALIKNPTGCDEVIRTVAQPTGTKRLLVIINDNAADGRDISWLWDADFEALIPALPLIKQVQTAGLRGEDMALRLQYAGIPAEQLTYQSDIAQAIAGAIKDTQPGETLYILPTYTALLAVKTALTKLGYSPNYWEE
ncbi:Mur ligase family protein [Heliophilum fasciatum]|uniref:Lipid II isoglutaminyl synthase (glutamine-hydrolyzing) subunit MurT n=1 Tax=Heliophilum fasciatum TaxID=35700 RepID=A0A4R2RZW0_9FIRM|nr:Mur ligase family protein [Heliophilum fasciatum]MCW2277037.1 UDP-N-acetylmuramyl tripeptide synthase [Heliophilum fasciatum]TCP68437.1 UDP-N-acetylmuramyl tripeptide synthase [Heliophilum fasciatum]